MSDEIAVATTPPTTSDVPAPPKGWLAWAQLAIHLLTTIIETFGWTGFVVLAFFFFIVHYATDAQKQEMIDLYVLGKGIGNIWPMVSIAGLFAVTSFAQHRWYKNKIKDLEEEVNREGHEKSKLQEKLIGKKLQHARPKNVKKR